MLQSGLILDVQLPPDASPHQIWEIVNDAFRLRHQPPYDLYDWRVLTHTSAQGQRSRLMVFAEGMSADITVPNLSA
jgi:hypothetical protein